MVDDENALLMIELRKFIAKRQNDHKPFYLLLNPHHSRHNWTPRLTRERMLAVDEDRVWLLNELKQAGLLEDSILFITGDHGSMEGEHGEYGHWQYESTWWDEKIRLPMYVCQPAKQIQPDRDMSKLVMPALASQVDIAPTFMSLLKIQPPLPSSYYSQGSSLIIPAGASDWTLDRYIVATARYFPKKTKTALILDRESKWWIRVNGYTNNNHNNNDNTNNYKLIFSVELYTDRKDNVICNFAQAQQAYEIFTQQPNIFDKNKDECNLLTLSRYLDDYERGFFTFQKL